MPRFAPPASRYGTIAPPLRRPAFYQNQKNHTYYNDHRPRIRTYPVSVVGFLPPDLLDESFYNDQPLYDDSGYAQPLAPQPDYAANGYPEPAPQDYQPYPQPQPQYPQPQYPQPQSQPEQEQAVPVAPQMQYVPGSADTVTLIFKDGRPPEQIHNYLATNKTLTVIDGNRHREIPITDINVSATINANRETGVGFQLPRSTP
jgi:hypothetical protein